MVDIKQLKLGDKVRIVSKWNEDTNQDIFGSMDKYLGTIMTVCSVGRYTVNMCEDNGEYYWNAATIEKILTTDSDPPEFLVADSDEFLDFLKR